MNFVIYSLTGVRKPEVGPEAMADLADQWEVVRNAASDVHTQVSAGIALVLSTNQGEATEAFGDYATDEDSARQQLEQLADAAARTRDTHRAAAVLLRRTTTQMDAVAAAAANALLKAQFLPPVFRDPYVAKLIRQTKQDLELLLSYADDSARQLYEPLFPHLPDLLTMSEEQARGSVPQEILDIWEDLDEDQRRALMEAIAEDAMSDWPPDAERPTIHFYSHEADLPDGAVAPPNGWDWSGNNGVAYDGDIWLNYDIMADPDREPVLLSTVVHELQHIEQGHMRDQYDDLLVNNPDAIDDIKAGRRPDPFIDQGSTVYEVERFQTDYEPARIEDENGNLVPNPYYQHQYVEIDARRAGTEYLDGLAGTRVEELLDEIL